MFPEALSYLDLPLSSLFQRLEDPLLLLPALQNLALRFSKLPRFDDGAVR